jgi:hypothetical protein
VRHRTAVMLRWAQLTLIAGLSSLLFLLLGLCLTAPARGRDASVGELLQPTVATLHLPLITRGYMPPAMGVQQVISLPIEHSLALSSWGPDHAAAFAPDGSGLFGAGGEWISTGISPNDHGGTYLYRSYVEVAIPAYAGRVISASLNLVPCTSWNAYYSPLPAATVTLHRGTWRASLGELRSAEVWGAWEAPAVGQLVTYHDPPCLDEGTATWSRTAIPLEPMLVAPETVLRLVLRDGEDHLDLRAAHPEGNRWFFHPPAAGPAYLTLRLEVPE